jgi:hypothetical protein
MFRENREFHEMMLHDLWELQDTVALFLEHNEDDDSADFLLDAADALRYQLEHFGCVFEGEVLSFPALRARYGWNDPDGEDPKPTIINRLPPSSN